VLIGVAVMMPSVPVSCTPYVLVWLALASAPTVMVPSAPRLRLSVGTMTTGTGPMSNTIGENVAVPSGMLALKSWVSCAFSFSVPAWVRVAW
jgi:hypothetical protein